MAVMRVAVLVLALSAIEASALRASVAGPISAFDTSCYMEADTAAESGGAKGRSYRGLVASTVSGRQCQKWSADHPWKAAAAINPTADRKENVQGEEITTWGNGLGNHNYCRNPDSSMDSPWCFTMDTNKGHKKELCEIPKCEGAARNFKSEAQDTALTIGSKDCECADQLYGSTKTTGKTAVPLTLAEEGVRPNARKGCPCKRR